MTTVRQWLGGGDNKASNPANWAPNGTPQAGELLNVANYGPSQWPSLEFQTFIMNVSGNSLAGDTVRIGVPPFSGMQTIFTANLSHGTMTATSIETDGTYNLTHNSSLDLSLFYGFQVGVTSAIVNITGSNRLTLDDQGAPATVNLAAGAAWNGTFKAEMGAGLSFPSSITVNGQAGSSFNNNGASSVTRGSATIGTAVTGHGSFDVVTPVTVTPSPSRLEFMQSVGSGQSISDAGLVVVDDPTHFSAHVTLKAGGELDLQGLANADGYKFRNDILSIYSAHTVVDRVHLTDQTPYGFVVSNVAGNTDIVAAIGPARV